MRRRALEHGFTVLEVIIALMVVLVGLLGVFALLNSSIVMNRDSAETAKATHFAQKRLEIVRNVPFYEVQAKGATTFATLSTDDGLADAELRSLGLSGTPSWNREVMLVGTYDSGDALKRVVVTVTWGRAGETRRVSLATYISRNGLSNTGRAIEAAF